MSTTPATISISPIGTETVRVPILGTSPLIVHRFAEKAKRAMLDKQQGRVTPKENRDPNADYENAFYRTDDDGYGFPVIAFKAATVGAARYYGKSVAMTELRQWLFFDGPFSKLAGQRLAPITGEPHCREDVVRLSGSSSTDLRYRPEFTEWSTVLEITYVKTMLTLDSMLSLVEAGGMGVGVGEWRPEKRGEFGTYVIDPTREIVTVSK